MRVSIRRDHGNNIAQNGRFRAITMPIGRSLYTATRTLLLINYRRKRRVAKLKKNRSRVLFLYGAILHCEINIKYPGATIVRNPRSKTGTGERIIINIRTSSILVVPFIIRSLLERTMRTPYIDEGNTAGK